MTEQPDAPPPRPRPRPGGRPRPVPGTRPVVPSPIAGPAGPGRVGRRHRWWLVPVVSAALVVLVIAVAVLVLDRRAPQSAASPQTADGAVLVTPELADAYRSAAAADIAAVTNYDYRRLGDALSSGLAVSTGTFRTAYRDALRGDLAESARLNRLVQEFELQRTGIGAVARDGRRATLLIFGVERLASGPDDDRRTRVREVSAAVTLVRDGDRFLISDLVDGGSAGSPTGSAELLAAVRAGSMQVRNLYSFRHDAFDADYARALAGAREPLTSIIRENAATTRASLTSSNSDLVGTVTAVGVEQAAVSTVDLLVVIRIVRLAAGGESSDPTVARFAVTVVQVGGRWYTTVVDQIEQT